MKPDWDNLRLDLPDKAERDETGLFTAHELAEAYGVIHNHANHWIRDAIREGKVEFVGSVRRTRVTGVPYPAPAYRLVKKQGE